MLFGLCVIALAVMFRGSASGAITPLSDHDFSAG
jgi:hypothetical protein